MQPSSRAVVLVYPFLVLAPYGQTFLRPDRLSALQSRCSKRLSVICVDRRPIILA